MKIEKFRDFYRLKRFFKLAQTYWNIWRVYALCFFKKRNNEQIRVVIFGQGRTGSTLLESLICSTEYFKKQGELLGHGIGKRITFPYFYIIGKSKERPSRHFIFHLKLYHLMRDKENELVVKLLNKLSNNGWSIIYLSRKNKLKQVLSNSIVEQRKQYHKFDDRLEKIRLNVDPEEIIRNIKGRCIYDKLEKEVLDGLDYLELAYETHLQDSISHEKTVKLILEFLDLKSSGKVQTELKRINTTSLKDLVVNYDDLYFALKENNMLTYLD